MLLISLLMNVSERPDGPLEFTGAVELKDYCAFFAFVFFINFLATSAESQRLSVWANSL